MAEVQALFNLLEAELHKRFNLPVTELQKLFTFSVNTCVERTVPIFEFIPNMVYYYTITIHGYC